MGADAQKRFLHQELPTAPLLHFSTHAIGDTRDPERSRILLAPAAPGAPADYLFLREIYDLDLTGVQLVTLVGVRHGARQGDPGRGRGRIQPRAACGRRGNGGHDEVGCRRPRQRGVHEAVLLRPCARAIGSVGAATGEAAVPAFAAGVVASALLGRVCAERRRSRAAPARGAVERAGRAHLLLSALAVVTGARRFVTRRRRALFPRVACSVRSARRRRFGRQPRA